MTWFTICEVGACGYKTGLFSSHRGLLVAFCFFSPSDTIPISRLRRRRHLFGLESVSLPMRGRQGDGESAQFGDCGEGWGMGERGAHLALPLSPGFSMAQGLRASSKGRYEASCSVFRLGAVHLALLSRAYPSAHGEWDWELGRSWRVATGRGGVWHRGNATIEALWLTRVWHSGLVAL